MCTSAFMDWNDGEKNVEIFYANLLSFILAYEYEHHNENSIIIITP